MSALITSRITGAVLVMTAGVAAIIAATQRWAGCPRPGFDAQSCAQLEDHQYDAQFPSDPWVPVGHAAEWEGIGYLLLAVGLCLVGAGTRRVWWRTLMQLMLGASLAVIGVATLASGLRGAPVAQDLDGRAALLWAWVGPALLMAGLGISRAAVGLGPRRFGLWLAGVFVVVMTTPLAEFVLIPTFSPYRPYDSLPWSGAIRGFLLIAAGLLFLTAILLPRRAEGGLSSTAPPRAPRAERDDLAGATASDTVRG